MSPDAHIMQMHQKPSTEYLARDTYYEYTIHTFSSMRTTNLYQFLLPFIWLLPCTAWAYIPMDNPIHAIKSNKVSYVKLRMCGEGSCYATEDRYDDRGNNIYSHLLRMGSGNIQMFNDKNQCMKAGWGIWGMPDSTMEWHSEYTYDGCGQELLVVYPSALDTIHYENIYGPSSCQLIRKIKVASNSRTVVEQHLYNSHNRLVRSSYGHGSKIMLHDHNGNVILEMEFEQGAKKVERHFIYDSNNRLVNVEIASNQDGFFDLKSETRVFTYDSLGRIQRHREFFDDPCMGGYYMDLEYEYLHNGLLAGAYWHGKKDKGLVLEYLYKYH